MACESTADRWQRDQPARTLSYRIGEQIQLLPVRVDSGSSTKVVAKWTTDENFNTAIPNAPKITSGKVVVHSNGVAVA